MVYVTVRDGFSREHDPHLHTHVIVMNITKYKGKFMGLWTREILSKDFNKLWGTIYRNHLASHLKNMGYSITYSKSGEWRLDNISKECEREFSTRRRQIKTAKSQGALDIDSWRKTRKDKQNNSDKKSIIKAGRDGLRN